MKNKKLLTRLFALLASLVLVFALALPCFADDAQPEVQYQDFVIDSFEDLNAFVALNLSGVYSATLYNGNLSDYVFYGAVDVSNNIYFTGTVSFANDGHLFLQTFSADFDVALISGYSFLADYVDNQFEYEALPQQYDSFDESLRLVIYNVPVSSTPADPATPSSDMYSNLFNILKDAIYGSDVELTGSQEYALTLISTILTYATILLPVILVIFIAVWCFKRF